MAGISELNELIIKNIQKLPEKDKREALKFIEYLKIKEDHSFIDYVNERTKQVIEAKRRGERFIPLEELQKDYA